MNEVCVSSLWTVTISTLTSATAVTLVLFVFREALKNSLKRRVDAYVETLKHDLQREALKAELSTKQKHIIYPRALTKLRQAEAALLEVASGEWQRNWMDLDEEELTRDMLRMRMPARHRANLLDHFRRDRNVGFQELQLAARHAAYDRAKRLAAAAKTYIVRNALYLNEPVRTAALATADKMLDAALSLEMLGDLQGVHTAVEELDSDLPSLEATMQRELEPKDAHK